MIMNADACISIQSFYIMSQSRPAYLFLSYQTCPPSWITWQDIRLWQKANG